MATLKDLGKIVTEMEDLFEHLSEKKTWAIEPSPPHGYIIKLWMTVETRGEITLATYNPYNNEYWLRIDKLTPEKKEKMLTEASRFKNIQVESE